MARIDESNTGSGVLNPPAVPRVKPNSNYGYTGAAPIASETITRTNLPTGLSDLKFDEVGILQGTAVQNTTSNMTGEQLLKNTKLAGMAMDYAVARGISPNASWLWNLSGANADQAEGINYVQAENGWKQYSDGSYEDTTGIKYTPDEFSQLVSEANMSYDRQQAKAAEIAAMSPDEQVAAFKENFPELSMENSGGPSGMGGLGKNFSNVVTNEDIPNILADYLDTRKAHIADLNALAGKVTPDKEQVDAFVTNALSNWPKFLDGIRVAGRNANTEALLKAAYGADITDNDIRNMFGLAPILSQAEFNAGFPYRSAKDYQDYVAFMKDTSVASTLAKIRDAGIASVLTQLSQGARWLDAKAKSGPLTSGGLFGAVADSLAEDSWYWQPGQILDPAPTPWAQHWANAWNWRAWGTNLGIQAPSAYVATVFSLYTFGATAPAFGAAATSLGASPFVSAVVSTVGGSQLPILLGASQSAASTYDQALAKWGDPVKAMQAANSVFNQAVASGEISMPLQMAVAFAPIKAPLTTLNNGVKSGLFAVRTVGGRMVIDGLTNAGQALYVDIKTRQALGQDVKLDDEMKMTLAMAAIQGSAFSAYGSMQALGNAFKTRIYDSLPAASQELYIKAHDEAISGGADEKTATLKALDAVAMTPDGKKVIKAVTETAKVESYESDLLTKITDEVQKTALEASLNHQKEAIKADTGIDVAAAFDSLELSVDERITGKYGSLPEGEMPGHRFSGVIGEGNVTPEALDKFLSRATSKRLPVEVAALEAEIRDYAFGDIYYEYKQDVPRAQDMEQYVDSLLAVTRKYSPQTEATAKAESVSRYDAAVVEPRIIEIKTLLETEGRLPTGKGTKEQIRLELATLTAQKEIAARGNDVAGIRADMEAIQLEQGNRSMPFNGRAKANFKDYTTKQLDTMLGEYDKALKGAVGEGPGTPSWGEFFKSPEASHDWIKKELTNYIRAHVPMEERGKLLIQVRDAKTMEDLDFAINKANRLAEAYHQKLLKSEITKALSSISPKKDNGILKGKFGADVQERLNAVKHNVKMDREDARVQIQANIEAFNRGDMAEEAMRSQNEILDNSGLDGMSAQELSNTLDYITSLKDYGRSATQQKIEQAKMARMARIEQEIPEITGGKPLKVGAEGVPTDSITKKASTIDKLINRQYSIWELGDKLTKLTGKPFKETGLYKFFTENIYKARESENAGIQKAVEDVQTNFDRIFNVKSAAERKEVFRRMANEKVNLGDVNGNPLELTKGQIIKKFQELSDPTLNDTFYAAMHWNEGTKKALVDSLTPQEKAWAAYQMDWYQSYYESVNSVYKELYSVDMPHNPNYSPISRTFTEAIPEDVLVYQDLAQFASTLNGSLKSRSKNNIPLKFTDANDVFINHIMQMEHFKAWTRPMSELRSFFLNPEIKQAIYQNHGTDILGEINTNLNRIANAGIDRSHTVKFLDKMRANFATAVIGVNPRQFLQQVPTVLGYMTDMNPGEFISGVADFWTNPVAHDKWMMENSSYIKARYTQGMERDIAAAKNLDGYKKFTGGANLRDALYFPMTIGDKFGVMQGWWAEYKTGIKAGLSEADAMNKAGLATDRMQNTSSLDTLSSLQSGGTFWKLLTMFQSQPNKYFRVISTNLSDIRNARGNPIKAAANIAIAWAVLPAIFQLIADGFQFKKDNQLQAWALGPINDILVGGQVAQQIGGWIAGETWNYQPVPMLDTISDVQIGSQKFNSLMKKGGDPYKNITSDDIWSFIEAVSKPAGEALGIPTPYFINVEKGLRANSGLKSFFFSQYALQEPTPDLATKTNNALDGIGEPITDANLAADKEISVKDTASAYSAIKTDLAHTLPSDVTQKNGFSPRVSSAAQAILTQDTLETLPGQAVYSILDSIRTDDSLNYTITQYYLDYQARKKITNLADLKTFDTAHPRYAYGNLTTEQYNLALQYEKLTTDAARKQFKLDHPELSSNPRESYLTDHPSENAQLALWGQADVLTLAAYSQLQTLLTTLDIPTSAISNKIPTPAVSKSYFAWNDAATKYGTSSPEAKLARANDAALEKWGETNLNWSPVKDSLESLQIQVKYASNYDAYAALDTTAKKNDYLAKNPVFRDNMYKATGLDYTDKSGNHMSSSLALKYVAYRKASSPTAYRRANLDLNNWMVNAGAWQPLS